MKQNLKQEIQLTSTAKRRAIMNALEVTNQALGLYLKFKRNSPKAVQAREMALRMGGTLMQEVRRTEVVKVLDRKGNIERVITLNK